MKENTTQIIVSGVLGKMGECILRLASHDESISVVGGLERQDRVKTAAVAGREFRIASTLAELNPEKGSVLIDFSESEATVEHAEECVNAGVGMVIGTTGLGQSAHASIQHVSRSVPVVVAPNMSVGINLLLDVVRNLASVLSDYDIEIVETHHRMKRDAPSGTALALGNAVADGRGTTLGQTLRHGRSGNTGERTHGEIGMHAVRGGDVVGDHMVIFAGTGERIEIGHRASSRDTFAAGALRAAKFVARKENGLYTMQDVLRLKQ